jgi:predicted MPP superfamily phosphohydrolase
LRITAPPTPSLWPFKYFVYLQQPYVAGLVQHESTWLYVSPGTGYYGPPMRLFAPSEITRITLRAGA